MSEAVAERVPPYSEEAERGVLGSMLLSPADAIRVMGLALHSNVRPEAFYVPAHEELFATIKGMIDANAPIDLLTVGERLKTAGALDRVGGGTFLERLVDSTPTAAHAEYYIGIVHEKHQLRRMIGAAREIVHKCIGGEIAAREMASRAMAAFQEVGNDLIIEGRTNEDVMNDLVANWERAYESRRDHGEHLPGLKTPFWRMNQVFGGMQLGLHFFGGKSSAGKTALMCNLMYFWAASGHPGLVIQLDDTHEDMIGRMVAMRSGTSLPALSQGFTKRDKLDRIREEIGPDITKLPIKVIEECEDVLEACDIARYYRAKDKIEWVVVDYVQILEADGNPRDDERARLGKIAKYLKRLWKELRIPVLAVSQTSKFKDAEDNGRKADMSDLFGASELFHAATTVTILKKIRDIEEQPVPESGNDFTKKYAVACHVAKNKHGPKDQLVHFWLTPRYFKFEETGRTGTGTNERQMTWEEEIEEESPSHQAYSSEPEPQEDKRAEVRDQPENVQEEFAT